MLVTRRSLVMWGTAAAAATVAGRAIALERSLTPTVTQTIGPFYPVARPLDQDTDLTIVRGNRGKARGQVINIVGRVLDPGGRPVPNAKLDVWQANAGGRYAHPGDTTPAPLDPDFQGAAMLWADDEGRYRFRTIKPGAYGERTPHIHLDVTGRAQRIITQMYFPAEPLNETDGLLTRIPAGEYRDRLIAQSLSPLADDPETPAYEWDIVLMSG